MKFIIPKGTYEYIKKKKVREIVKTILMFGISLAIYLAGYLTVHSNKNLLTIVAVLGCLPASKSAVSMIMFLRAKGCSEELKKKLDAQKITLSQRYDLYLTSYQKNFQISHVVMKNKNLIGITESEKFDENACYEHLKDMFSKNGFKDITVKIFSDSDKYLERLNTLQHSEMEEKEHLQEEVLHLMENLSL